MTTPDTPRTVGVQNSPTELDWKALLEAAASRGVRVWRVNRLGDMVPIESLPESG